MKVLMLSTDSSILEEGSAAHKRIVAYAALADELSVLVFSDKERAPVRLTARSVAYPIRGGRLVQMMRAYRMGKGIIAAYADRSDALVTDQDPFEIGLVGYRIARATGAKLQLQVHTDLLSPYFSRGSLVHVVRTMIARFLLPRADGIRVVSERIKNSLIKEWHIPESRITVLPIYVDRDRVQQAGDNTILKPFAFAYPILTFARVEREKNTTLAIDVLKLVRDVGIDARLVVLGTSNEEAMLKKKSAGLGLADKVLFKGNVSDTGRYFRAAAALLGTSNFEGYGLTFVEAAFAGCPVVTTDVGLAGELLTPENAGMCPVGDAECLAQKLIELFKNPGLREQKTAALQTAVEGKAISKEDYLRRYRQSWERCVGLP